MKNQLSVVALVFLLLPLGSAAKSLILPVEAIEDAGKLSLAEFEESYPGIDVSGYFPDEVGYYVTYSHENLTYYFGPVEDAEEALRYKEQLVKVVDEASGLRISLKKASVEVYQFDPDLIEEYLVQVVAAEQVGAGAGSDAGAEEGQDGDGGGRVIIVDGSGGTGGDGEGGDGRAMAGVLIGPDGKPVQGGQIGQGGSGAGGGSQSGSGSAGSSGSNGSGDQGSGDSSSGEGGEGGGFFSNIWKSIFGG